MQSLFLLVKIHRRFSVFNVVEKKAAGERLKNSTLGQSIIQSTMKGA
jgi:hypothetical protein